MTSRASRSQTGWSSDPSSDEDQGAFRLHSNFQPNASPSWSLPPEVRGSMDPRRGKTSASSSRRTREIGNEYSPDRDFADSGSAARGARSQQERRPEHNSGLGVRQASQERNPSRRAAVFEEDPSSHSPSEPRQPTISHNHSSNHPQYRPSQSHYSFPPSGSCSVLDNSRSQASRSAQNRTNPPVTSTTSDFGGVDDPPWSKVDQRWYIALTIYATILWLMFLLLGASFLLNRGQDIEPHKDIKGAVWGGFVFGFMPIFFIIQFWCYRCKFRHDRAAFEDHFRKNRGALGALFLLMALWGGFSLVLAVASFPIQDFTSLPVPLSVVYDGTSSNCFSQPTNTTLWTLVWINYGIPGNNSLICRTEENPVGAALGLIMGLSSIPLAVPAALIVLAILAVIIGIVFLCAAMTGGGSGGSGGDCGFCWTSSGGGGGCRGCACRWVFCAPEPNGSCPCPDCGCCSHPEGWKPGAEYLFSCGGWCHQWWVCSKGRQHGQVRESTNMHELESQERRAERKKTHRYERLEKEDEMESV